MTRFNVNAVSSIQRMGFEVTSEEKRKNPIFSVRYSTNKTIKLFSKLYNNSENKSEKFAAIMTCHEGDQRCPLIQGSEKRISLFYEDPKIFDDKLIQKEKYDALSLKIASELFYVFREVSKK